MFFLRVWAQCTIFNIWIIFRAFGAIFTRILVQKISRLRREFPDEKYNFPLKNSAAGENFSIFQYNFHDFHLKILKISACGGQILPKFPA